MPLKPYWSNFAFKGVAPDEVTGKIADLAHYWNYKDKIVILGVVLGFENSNW